MITLDESRFQKHIKSEAYQRFPPISNPFEVARPLMALNSLVSLFPEDEVLLSKESDEEEVRLN